MSSPVFSACLTFDQRLRRWRPRAFVLAAGSGIWLCLMLPVDVVLRLLLAAAWAMALVRSHTRQRRCAQRVRRLVLRSDGGAVAVDRAGDALPVTLAPGSHVGRSLAWLRLRFDDGAQYGEFLTRDAVKEDQWHALRLLWRQRVFSGASS